MEGRQRLSEEESVLRRFDPENPDHYSFDEQLQRKRLRATCFTFHKYEGEDTTGCSVFRDGVLMAEGLPRESTLEHASWKIAEAIVEAIRAIEHGGDQPLDAVEDPYPDGEIDCRDADVAHALIVAPVSLGRSAMDKIRRQLARDVFVELSDE